MNPRLHNDRIQISPIDLPVHNNRLCDFCPYPQLAYYHVWHRSDRHGYLHSYCCDRCREGWQEISDSSIPFVR